MRLLIYIYQWIYGLRPQVMISYILKLFLYYMLCTTFVCAVIQMYIFPMAIMDTLMGFGAPVLLAAIWTIPIVIWLIPFNIILFKAITKDWKMRLGLTKLPLINTHQQQREVKEEPQIWYPEQYALIER